MCANYGEKHYKIVIYNYKKNCKYKVLENEVLTSCLIKINNNNNIYNDLNNIKLSNK